MCLSVSDMLISAEEALGEENLPEARSYLEDIDLQTGGRPIPGGEGLQARKKRLWKALIDKERLLLTT